MYARRQPDELIDEDDMDDEELVRLVDQTNEDDVSVTEDPIFIEEKLLRDTLPLETRGHAVGADTSDDSMSDRATPDRMYKLVLAGNAAVGKSSFIIRLCRNKFYSALNSTLGKKTLVYYFVEAHLDRVLFVANSSHKRVCVQEEGNIQQSV